MVVGWHGPTDQEFTKMRLLEHTAVRGQCLAQDLLFVGDKQKLREFR